MTKKALVPIQAPALAAAGLTGAVAATRYVGGTASGAPSTGTFVTGDWIMAQNAHVWVCTAGGSPGTWVDASAGGSGTPATTVQTESGLDAGQVGTSTNYAREDHRHPITNLVDLSSTQTITGAKTFNPAGSTTFGPAGTAIEVLLGQSVAAIGTASSQGALVFDNQTAATSGTPNQMPGVLYFNGRYWTGAASSTYSATLGAYRKTTSQTALQATTDIFEVLGAITTTSTITENGNRVYSAGNVPPYPVTTVAGRAGAVTLAIADIAAGTSPAGTFNFAGTLQEAGSRVYSAGNPNLSATTPADVAAAAAIGTGTTFARADHAHQGVTSINTRDGAVTLTAADIAAGTFPGANAYSGLQTFNAGVTVPSGQALITGTRSVVTGTRATTTNATDTVNLGTFSTTGGAIELRIHAHLAAPAAGSTASVTKVYEIAANATMGTLNTWYLCLPTDASAAAAAANDFALEVERTASGTFVFRFRQKTIGVAGTIAFTAETLGDTAVTFTSSSTVTAAPAAVTTPHPSNFFVAAAGNIGIGTDAPLSMLSVGSTAAPNAQINVVSSATQAILVTGTASSASTGINLVNSGATGSTQLAVIETAGSQTTDSALNDTALTFTSGQTLRLGVLSTSATLLVTGSDVQVNDSGTSRSLPRGFLGRVTLPSNYVPAAATTLRVLASGQTVALVAGRRYRATVRQVASLGAASTTAATAQSLYLNSATIAQGSAPAGTLIATVGFPIGVQSGYGVAGEVVVDFTCAASGGDITPGSYVIIIAGQANQATTATTWFGSATPSNRCSAMIEDMGT